jgi:hypothetical protein
MASVSFDSIVISAEWKDGTLFYLSPQFNKPAEMKAATVEQARELKAKMDHQSLKQELAKLENEHPDLKQKRTRSRSRSRSPPRRSPSPDYVERPRRVARRPPTPPLPPQPVYDELPFIRNSR